MPGLSTTMSLRDLFNPAAGGRSADFAVLLDHRLIPVRVARHPRARRLRLRFDSAAGELRLVMPPRGSLTAARVWVDAQGDWIRRQLATRPVSKQVGPGTLLPWDGQTLAIVWDAAMPRAPRLDGVTLSIGGPRDRVAPRVQRWLVDQARSRFTQITRDLAAQAGLSPGSVSVGDPRSRWGSCSAAGNIRYSWRVIMAPGHVQQALCAHEVAHLAHMNHGPAFHALAQKLTTSDPHISRAWLREHGASLHLWRFD